MVFNLSKSYDDMLNKIGVFTLIFLLGGWFIIMRCFPCIKQTSDWLVSTILSINKPIKIFDLELSFSYIVPMILAVVCRCFRLHNIVSNIFNIRMKYDISNIILPLAEGVGYSINSIEKIKEKRTDIMRDVFYKYAGYTSPVIDRHLINMTLDSLCWYWITVEGLIITFCTFVVILFSYNLIIIRIVFFIIILLLLVNLYLKKQCINYSKMEVNAILNDNGRKSCILGVFNAL